MISLVGGVAAVLAAAALLGGIAGMATGRSQWSPWLAVLYGYNAEYRVTSRDALRGVHTVDVALLLLAGTTYAGFWPGPGTSHIVWMTLAIAQPLLGIPLLMVTKLSGRSGLMGGALVLSILMLVDATSAMVAGLGVSASILLLVGDFGTNPRPSRILAGTLAVGCGSLAIWFCALAALLLT
ncbi:hypothetical protein [Raineyella sp.]|uniref:Uncharacterized protein n=1 Tax=bioreactor metagenome TaxID=1076179 RepID=A0A645AY26_9ZZZZ|nr:hypothetical protein [Raineyella sp.]MEA5153366.1 hypothetical protein [Raineyella sp.]